MTDHLRATQPTHGGYGMPRGPLGTPPENAPTCAIGFCPMCGANARQTCSNHGVFDCPGCTFVWYDDRVMGEAKTHRDFSDYFKRS